MSSRHRAARTQIRVAAALMLVQGVLMEDLPFLALPVLLLLHVDPTAVAHGFSFIVPFFNEHPYLLMVMSGIVGAMRVTAAIGLLKNRLWGYWLAVVNCIVTLVVMLFMLPAGIADGLLSDSALLLLLITRYGDAPIHSDAS